MTTDVKLFAISMATVGSMVSTKSSGPYRKVTEVERFGEIYRIWLEPGDGGSEYLDGVTGDSLWQPHAPAEFTPVDEIREARETETVMEEAAAGAAAGFVRPPAEVDAGELAHLYELGLA